MFSIVGAARRRRYVINHGRRRIVETDAGGRPTNWKNCMKTFRPLGWRSLRGSGNSPTGCIYPVQIESASRLEISETNIRGCIRFLLSISRLSSGVACVSLLNKLRYGDDQVLYGGAGFCRQVILRLQKGPL